MARRAKRASKWVADFETTTALGEDGRVRVWSWGLVNCDDFESFEWGDDIDTFIDRMAQLGETVYFHNLKFDVDFILPWLFEHGYTHTTSDNLGIKEFNTMIDGMGKTYSVKVRWHSGRETNFLDSLKLLAMSVAKIAKAFNLPMLKGDIDYHLPRPKGYVPTDEEIDYLRRDVLIVAAALNVLWAEGQIKMTSASNALHEFKKITGTKHFALMFPILDEEVDQAIRESYRGGFTYVNPKFQGFVVGRGSVFDVNSMYPAVMYQELLPYGKPYFEDGPPEPDWRHPLWVTQVTFTAYLKRDHIPCIQLNKGMHFSAAQYVTEIPEPVTMTVTSVDWELWNEQYDIYIDAWHGTWYFSAAPGPFNEYIDKWMEVKANSTGGRRQIAKLMLNSLYGKFGTATEITSKVPFMDEDGVVRFKPGVPETRDPVYIPMATFITSYARGRIVRAAQSQFHRFAYADTDSLHLIGDKPVEGLYVHPSDLGAWKREGAFKFALYAVPKRYTELMGEDEHGNPCHKWVTHAGGLRRDLHPVVRFSHYLRGHEFPDGKMVQTRVPGGAILTDQPFKFDALLAD